MEICYPCVVSVRAWANQTADCQKIIFELCHTTRWPGQSLFRTIRKASLFLGAREKRLGRNKPPQNGGIGGSVALWAGKWGGHDDQPSQRHFASHPIHVVRPAIDSLDGIPSDDLQWAETISGLLKMSSECYQDVFRVISAVLRLFSGSLVSFFKWFTR